MKKYLFLAIGLIAIAVILAFNLIDVEAYALDENNCLSCHGDESLVKTTEAGNRVSLYVNETEVNASSHRFIDCTTCHTTEPHKVNTPLNKLSLAEKCGTCHQYEYKQHLESVHGQQLVQGNPDVATCVDCHSADSNPHSVIRVLEYTAPTYKKNIAETCAKCHNNKELMTNYGIVEDTYETYMRSFHGKAILLGSDELKQLNTATCTNCHGYHDIKSVNDPTSPVAGLENLAKTCDQCHIDAGVTFASSFLGHKEVSSQSNPAVHYTEIIFTVLLTTVIAFGIIVVVTAIVRFSINRWRE